MESFGVVTAITMLVFLYRDGKTPFFTFIQTIQFAEYPIQVWANHFQPTFAWYLWHDLNQLNILLSLAAAVSCIDCFSAVSYLLLLQCALKLFKYYGIDVSQDYTLDAVYHLHKFIDPTVNLCVVWYTLRQRRFYELQAEAQT